MKKYFSSTTRCFYWEEDKAAFDELGQWPSDVVEISESDWMNFQGAAPFGKLPAVNNDGSMLWESDPDIDMGTVILQNNTAIRNAKLNSASRMAFPLQSAVALGAATETQVAELAALQRYVVNLMEMSDLAVAKPDWPQLGVT